MVIKQKNYRNEKTERSKKNKQEDQPLESRRLFIFWYYEENGAPWPEGRDAPY